MEPLGEVPYEELMPEQRRNRRPGGQSEPEIMADEPPDGYVIVSGTDGRSDGSD